MGKYSKIILLSFLLICCFNLACGIRVTFCSGENMTGTCATKNVETGIFRNKCEDFPKRFRWFFTARSIRVEGDFMGYCPSRCTLSSSDNCRCWFGNCPEAFVSCKALNLPDYHPFRGIRCNT